MTDRKSDLQGVSVGRLARDEAVDGGDLTPSADSKGLVDTDYDHEVGSRMKQHGSPQ